MVQRLLWAVVWVTLVTPPSYAEKFLLTNGDQITGCVIRRDKTHIIIEHPVLGQLALPVDQIKTVLPSSDAKAIMSGATALKQVPPEPSMLKPTNWADRLRKTWKSKLEVGSSTHTGNTDQSAIYLRFKTTATNKKTKTDLDAVYDRQAKKSETTIHEFTTGLRREWFISDSKWSYFGQGRWDYDEFQSWDKRISAALGVGYQWSNTPQWKLNFQFGAGGVKEFGSDNDQVRPEWLSGFNLNWKLSESQRLGGGATYYPDLSDPQQFRVVSDAYWLLKLNKADGIALKIGLENEHQSQVDPGKKHDDFRLFSTLVFDF